MKDNQYFSTVMYRETGIKHLEKGKGCEDNVYTTYSADSGVKSISLSDGAGSYSNAAVGRAAWQSETERLTNQNRRLSSPWGVGLFGGYDPFRGEAVCGVGITYAIIRF